MAQATAPDASENILATATTNTAASAGAGIGSDSQDV